MNKTRMIWGIICTGLAVVLVVLNFTLPPGSQRFTIGGIQLPWVLPVVLCITGCVLLVTAGGGKRAAVETRLPETHKHPEKVALNKRLEAAAWGLFLIMLGGFAFVPRELVNGGLWSMGVGAIMLGLNLARYFNQIRMSGFTTVLGILSVLGGAAGLIGSTSWEGAFLLIILGAYLVLKPWFDQHQLFGKAEESRP